MLTHFLGRPRGLFSFGGSFEKEIDEGMKHIQTPHFTDTILVALTFKSLLLLVYFDWPYSYCLWVFPLAFWDQEDQQAPERANDLYLSV